MSTRSGCHHPLVNLPFSYDEIGKHPADEGCYDQEY
jgi:hypothetical protein